MTNIYKNSLFTIAAKEPDSCKKGFLGEQHYGLPEWQRALNIEVPGSIGGPADGLLVRVASHDNGRTLSPEWTADQIFSAATRPHSATECSLDKRGWCLQESILPNRILFFDDNEMAWECIQRGAYECTHHDHSNIYSKHSELKTGLRHGRPDSTYSTMPERFDFHRQWISLVENYSRRHLTRGSDKLAPLSGLANSFLSVSSGTHSDVRDTYCAGLWKSAFVRGLGWAIDPQFLQPTGRDQHTLYEGFCAPTWSWCSLDGPVTYMRSWEGPNFKYGTMLESHVQVDGVNCVPSMTSNPTGSITSAFAELTAPLAEVQLAILEEESKFQWYRQERRSMIHHVLRRALPMCKTRCLVRARNLESFEVLMDIPMKPTLRRDDQRINCWTRGRCKADCCTWESRDDETSPRYFCLKLFSWKCDPGGRMLVQAWGIWYPPETWFLVLKLFITRFGLYERVGLRCSSVSLHSCYGRGPSLTLGLFEKSKV
ncbi:hypothetical protein F5Y12DRAFT_390828 [Xylaria sp. FL1777]|nr:hypothetical protein F5Y12DRAFT_390828 [Xylaria sp. FL1777]